MHINGQGTVSYCANVGKSVKDFLTDSYQAEPLTTNDIFKLIKKEWQENPE